MLDKNQIKIKAYCDVFDGGNTMEQILSGESQQEIIDLMRAYCENNVDRAKEIYDDNFMFDFQILEIEYDKTGMITRLINMMDELRFPNG